MAHIRKVNSRRQPWVVRFRTPDGIERSKSFGRKTDAEAFRASVETARYRGELVDPAEGRIQLDAWSRDWLAIVAPELKPKTLASYRSLLDSRILPVFGSWSLVSLRPGDVDTWVSAMRADGLSPSRIRQAHVVLSAMLELAVRHDRIPRNVARGADLPSVRRKEAAYFDPATVDGIVNAVPDPYGPFIAVQGVLGLRFGEAAALRRRSVDLLHRRIRVEESLAEISGTLLFGSTKSHAARSVPVPPALLASLEEHLATRVRRESDGAPLHLGSGISAAVLAIPAHGLGTHVAEPRTPRDGDACPSPFRRGRHDPGGVVSQGRATGPRTRIRRVHADGLRPPVRRRPRRTRRRPRAILSRYRRGTGSRAEFGKGPLTWLRGWDSNPQPTD